VRVKKKSTVPDIRATIPPIVSVFGVKSPVGGRLPLERLSEIIMGVGVGI